MPLTILPHEVRVLSHPRTLAGSPDGYASGLESNPSVLTRSDLVEALAAENQSAMNFQRLVPIPRGGRRVGPRNQQWGARRVLRQPDLVSDKQHRSLEPVKAIARWYGMGESSLEELILQLFFVSVPLADIQSLTTSLWGCPNGAEMVCGTVEGVEENIDRYSSRPLETLFRYVYLQSVEIRRHCLGDRRVTRLASAIGINDKGYRELLGVVAEPESSGHVWDLLLADLVKRGLPSPHLMVIENGELGRLAVKRYFPGSVLLVAATELERGLLQRVNPPQFQLVVDTFARLKACTTRGEGERVAAEFIRKLMTAGYSSLLVELRTELSEQLSYLDFPREHWPRLREEKVRRSVLFRVRERLRLLGPVRDDRLIARLAVAAFRHEARTSWNLKPILTFGAA